MKEARMILCSSSAQSAELKPDTYTSPRDQPVQSIRAHLGKKRASDQEEFENLARRTTAAIGFEERPETHMICVVFGL